MIKIISASFVTSAASFKDTPPQDRNEIAFLGRSNVGKSSLINALLERKNLVKTSSTPGKTKLINFFDVEMESEEQRYLLRVIDLPGFGYAKVSKETRNWWDKSLSQFLSERESIKLFLHLIDSRHTSMESDLQIQDFLYPLLKGDQRVLQVMTKSDKLKQNDKAKLKRAYPESLMVSVLKKTNIDLLRQKVLDQLFGYTHV